MAENIPSSPQPQAGPGSARLGSRPAKLPLPAPGVVDVWANFLTASPAELQSLQQTLSSEELKRAARFHFDEHRRRFIVAHGRLRQLLSRYLSVPEPSIEFRPGRNGKPRLAANANHHSLQFNLTHSEDLALTAFVTDEPVGIDVERVRTLSDANELVRRFFTKREAAAFAIMPDDKKPGGFFRLWTRKEAWLKATGDGIAHLLDEVEVSFLQEEPARLLSLPEQWSGAADWSLCHLEPAPGYVGAVAVPRKHVEVRFFGTIDSRSL